MKGNRDTTNVDMILEIIDVDSQVLVKVFVNDDFDFLEISMR